VDTPLAAAPQQSAAPLYGSTPRQRGDTRITVESVIAEDDITRFYQLYLEAFGPLRTRAVARHVLHEDEFREEMVEPRIDKYVTWDADGRAIAMATLTHHLETVPWISPEYFAHHYPEATARDVVFYLGFILVEPVRQRGRVMTEITRAVVERVTEARGVCGYDLCALNSRTARLSDVVVAVSQDLSPVEIEVLDTQTYYCGVPEVARSVVKLPQMRRTDP
jgi:hypothetical protein